MAPIRPRPCPSCQHPGTGLLARLLEPLVWRDPCCHTLVHDPLGYPGDNDCGCRNAAHRRAWEPASPVAEPHRWLSRSR
ncbi:hypothetical protein [Nocardioides lianchengensis]|uniref:Uncharacterized protein n=1 Tax=Nocardioides lianchengensis TaxID=1045774 RepID=A0A1G6XMC9_9ACTN|nr:hypothetical protein [Nocardioides lianchengensis]NYG13361.1 hypothetical protein [Nocardioides lianchengensis]SDD79202.1 hypothetical protein SAMN05421872_1114 [Nocardioides lianchengensis]